MTIEEAKEKVIAELKKGWCQDTNFVDKHGATCTAEDRVKCCLYGAMHVVLEKDIYYVFYKKLSNIVGPISIFNDKCKSVDEVIDAINLIE